MDNNFCISRGSWKCREIDGNCKKCEMRVINKLFDALNKIPKDKYAIK